MDETQFAEIDIRDIIGLLRRQLKLVIFLIVIALGIAGIALFTLKPVYTATTLILVDPNQKDLLDTSGGVTSGASASARIDSEVEILKSNSILLDVIAEKKLLGSDEFGVKLGRYDGILTKLRLSDGKLPTGNQALQGVLSKVRNSLSARRRGLTYLISVDFSAGSPDVAADLANAVSKSYITNQLAAKVQGALAVRDILGARIAQASDAISHSETALGDYVFANMDRISKQTGSVQFTALTSRLSGLELEQQNNDRLISVIQGGVREANWTSLSQSLGLEAVAELERQRQDLIKKIDNLASGATDNIDLQNELQNLESQMADKAATELARLNQTTLELQSQNVDLRSQIRVSAVSSNLPADMVTDIFELQQNAGEARIQYQTLLSRLREVETQVDLQVADSRIISVAVPPNKPSFPNKKLILALASMLGLGAGIGLAFLNEHYIGGFTSADQVESVLKIPVLAAMPKLKSGALPEGVGPAGSMLHAPLSSFSESIRRIRLGIDQVLGRRGSALVGDPGPKSSIIMVCSAVPGEGKTTAALSLARAYALSGQSTLLIDADMRRPSTQKELGITDPKFGLLEVLTNQPKSIQLSSALVSDSDTDLSILIGAKASNVPTDQLFASKKFAGILNNARNSFDIIILDTPPAGPVVDALYLAPYVDYLLFVVRWASTSQNDVKSAISQLKKSLSSSAQIGIVLNQQDNKIVGYNANYSGYYDEG